MGAKAFGWGDSSRRNPLRSPNDVAIFSAALKRALEAPGTSIGEVHVTRSAAAERMGLSGVSWTVTLPTAPQQRAHTEGERDELHRGLRVEVRELSGANELHRPAEARASGGRPSKSRRAPTAR